MKLVNGNGDLFECRVEGYMSEYKKDRYFQNNWLRGEIILSNGNINNRINLEFLQVEELIQLGEWLNQLEKNDKKSSNIFDFIDPRMRFRLWKRRNPKTIRFIYHSEEKDTFSWEMILNEKNVSDFERQINEIVIRFPIR